MDNGSNNKAQGTGNEGLTREAEMTETTFDTFTREMFLSMTPEQVVEFWRNEQRQRRDAGLNHYERLIDPTNDEIVATIDDADGAS
jgi:hypothetical protein